MELELPPVEEMPLQPGQRHLPVREQPEIGQVMNREQRAGRAQLGDALIDRFQIHRNQSGLPVVAVDDVGSKVEGLDRFQHGPIEKDEALAIVVVILAVRPVEPVAVEVTRLVDQVDQDVGSRQPALVDVALDRPGPYRDSNGDSRVGQSQRPADQPRR